jgi:hypothetical protein
MTPRIIYYINYVDPETGFIRREEFTVHRAQEERIAELKRKGVKNIVEGHYEE